MTSRSAVHAVSRGQVTKVHEDLGVVMGFAIVSKVDGEEYFDLQGDHIPEDELLPAALDFAKRLASAKIMHAGEDIGRVALMFPMTTEFAEESEMGTIRKTGLVICWQPHDKKIVKRFQHGPNGEPPELTGFSIGGTAEVVEVAA